MGYLGSQCYLAVDVATQSDGNELIRIRCKIFSSYQFPVAHIAVAYYCGVDIQCPAIILYFAKTEILDM